MSNNLNNLYLTFCGSRMLLLRTGTWDLPSPHALTCKNYPFISHVTHWLLSPLPDLASCHSSPNFLYGKHILIFRTAPNIWSEYVRVEWWAQCFPWAFAGTSPFLLPHPSPHSVLWNSSLYLINSLTFLVSYFLWISFHFLILAKTWLSLEDTASLSPVRVEADFSCLPQFTPRRFAFHPSKPPASLQCTLAPSAPWSRLLSHWWWWPPAHRPAVPAIVLKTGASPRWSIRQPGFWVLYQQPFFRWPTTTSAAITSFMSSCPSVPTLDFLG